MTSENATQRIPDLQNDCPTVERLSLFAVQALAPGEMAETAAHLLDCGTCADAVRGLVAWLAAGRRTAPARVPVADHAAVARVFFEVRLSLLPPRWRAVALAFLPEREVLAAADGQNDDQIQQESAIHAGFLHFAADLPEGHRDGWRAKLAIPSSVTEETLLRISVEDGSGRPVESGTLTFCGIPLDVRDGRVFMPVRTFRENLGKAMISLRRKGGKEVPGEPVLGGGMEN